MRTKAKPYIVLTEDEMITEIRNGNVNVSNLMSRSGMARGKVRGLIRKEYPAKPPARKAQNQAPVAPPALTPPADAPDPPKPLQKSFGRRFLAVGCLLTAVSFAAANAYMNAQFGASFGHGESDRYVLGVVNLTVDVGSLILVAVAAYFRGDKQYDLWAAALVLWLLCMIYSACSALGYTSNNVGDSLRARGSVSEQREDMMGQKKRAETYRGAIKETGDARVLENQMALAIGMVPTKNLKSSDNCTKPTISAPLCYDYNRIKDAYVSAKARDDLDKQIASLTGQIAALPPVSAKDPGAEQISQMARGWITADQVRNWLVRCLALIMSVSPGPLLAFARGLWR